MKIQNKTNNSEKKRKIQKKIIGRQRTLPNQAVMHKFAHIAMQIPDNLNYRGSIPRKRKFWQSLDLQANRNA